MLVIVLVLLAVVAATVAGRRAGGSPHRAVLAAAGISGLAVAAIGCGGSTAHQPPVAAPTTQPRATAPLSWGDAYDHVVVYAIGHEPGTAAADGGTPANPAGRGRAIGHTVAPATATTEPSAEQRATVTYLDGTTREVVIPAESLVAIGPRTDAETQALDAAQAGGLALLVLDRDGVVGPAGAAYVLLGDTLTQISEPGVSATTSPATTTVESAPDGTVAVTAPETLQAPDDGAFLDALRRAPGVVDATLVAPGVVAVATAGARAALHDVPGVAAVADDVLLDYAGDAREGEQWALTNTGDPAQSGGNAGTAGADSRVPRAWTASQGAGVLVAVIDSGIDLGHPDLAGRLWHDAGEICGNGVDDDADGKIDDCNGWDFGSNDADPSPDAAVTGSDHGTHVAGIIGAGRNGVGIAGVAPLATLMPLKVANATGAISSTAVFAAVIFAVDHGAQVINLSLATRPGTARSAVTALENAVLYARAAGVTVVAGAGNDGVDITPSSRSVWPASFSLVYDNVITAGATTNTDQVATFSNFGDPVTIYAPGAWLLSDAPGATYAFQSGTSQAAAMVSGAVADVIAAGIATSPSMIRTQLTSTAATISAGYRLDVAGAVGIPPDPVIAVTYGGADALVPDAAGTITMNVKATHMPSSVASVRLSIAAAVNYQVFAVQGVTAVVTPSGGGALTTASDAAGSFVPVPVADPATLASANGWSASITLALPQGDYAIVSELLDAGSQPMAGAQVAYLTVGAGTPVVTTTVTPSTTPRTTAVPTTTAAGVTTTRAGATTTTSAFGTGTTTTAAGGTSTTSTTAPGAGSTTSTTAAGATTSSVAAGSTTTTSPGATSTTSATGTTAPGASTSTSPAATTTTVAAGSTTSSVPRSTTTTVATSTTTTVAAPPSTTPPPPSASQGIYRIDTVSPRYATIAGGSTITITGAFPTTIPVNVWFGSKAIVPVTSSDGSTLVFASPHVLSAGVTDVAVRFDLDTSYTLTLTQAFTFGTTPAATTTTVRGATTTTATGGATTTTRAATTTTRAATTTTVRATTTSVAGATTTTRAGATTTTRAGATTTTRAGATTTTRAGATTTTAGPPSPTAQVHLQPAPANGAMARLSTTGWPRPGCKLTACPAATLP